MLHMCSAEPIAGLQATVLKCTASVIFGVGGMADLSLPCQDTVAFVGAWGLRPYCRRVGRRSAELCRAAVRLFAGLVSGAQITQRMTKQAASSVGRRPGGGGALSGCCHTLMLAVRELVTSQSARVCAISSLPLAVIATWHTQGCPGDNCICPSVS
jgi:hypothetical protein